MAASSQVKNYGSFGKNTQLQLQNTFVQKDAAATQTSTLVSPLFFRWNGMTKIFNRPTTDAFALQVKSEFTTTNAGHAMIEGTCDWKAAGATGGGVRALQGVSRLAATFTATGGSVIGTYGQACNLGTFNGSGAFLAGMYGLIEDGGTFTSISHIASGWFDTHLTKTVSAGSYELLYLTNNGTTQMNQALFIYGGNKITSLFKLDTCGGMVDIGGTVGGTLKKIAVDIDGTPYYFVVGTTVT